MPRKRKITGERQKRSLCAENFLSDYGRDGTLFAALVRSPAASGKITGIQAQNLPDGYRLFTADDIPGAKCMDIKGSLWPVFGCGQAEYTGEPLGILVGPDKATVLELLDKVKISFDVENFETALKKIMERQKKPLLMAPEQPEFPQERTEFSEFITEINSLPPLDADPEFYDSSAETPAAEREIRSGLYAQKSTAEAEKELFSKDMMTVSGEWRQRTSNPQWKETEGAFCYLDGKQLHVFSPTKWTGLLHRNITEILGIDTENVFIHKTKSSGNLQGGLWRTDMLAVQTAVASFLSKKPVRLMLSHKEEDRYLSPDTPAVISHRTAVLPSGKIRAMDIKIDIDIGAGNPFAQELVDRMALTACGYYRPENMRIRVTARKSKNPPTSISVKNTEAQTLFAVESHMKQLCGKTNVFPDDIRAVNSADTGNHDFPFTFHLGKHGETLSETIRASDFNRKYTSFRMDAVNRTMKDSNPFFALPLRGIGIASAFNTSGYLGDTVFTPDRKMEITLMADETLIIKAARPSDDVQEIWKNTAAETLQIGKDNITVDSEFFADELPEYPESSDNNIAVMNQLVKRCCAEIQRKRFHQPLPITAKKGLSSSAARKWKKGDFCGEPYTTMSFASAAVEVELDTYTYSERIKGIWITIDCGEILDEAAARKTIRLELQQELTALVSGKTVPCDSCAIMFVQSKNRSGQLNNLVHNTVPAAFASALSLALATRLTELPCTETQIFNLMKQRETGDDNPAPGDKTK